MVLLGLGTTWGCPRWLHREDYVFELSDDARSTGGCIQCLNGEDRVVMELSESLDEDGREAGKSGEGSVARLGHKPPSQYWLIGFKDRNLEREYLEDLVKVSSSRLVIGTFSALFLYVLFYLILAILSYRMWARLEDGEAVEGADIIGLCSAAGFAAAAAVSALYHLRILKVSPDPLTLTAHCSPHYC